MLFLKQPAGVLVMNSKKPTVYWRLGRPFQWQKNTYLLEEREQIRDLHFEARDQTRCCIH